MILAPEHPLAQKLLDEAGRARAKQMIDARGQKGPGDVEKEGIPTAAFAINPYSGAKIAGVDREFRVDGLWHGRDHGGAGAR